MSRARFRLCLAIVAMLVLAQSIAHMLATERFGVLDSIVDLDRSNGAPDLLSTAVIVAAAAGAAWLACRAQAWRRLIGGLLGASLAAIAVEDLLQASVGVSTPGEIAVTMTATAASAMLVAVERPAESWTTVALVAGLGALAASLVLGQLPELEQWFERARGDRIIELQIVAKQGLELAGWWLVAIVVWDIALAQSQGGTPVGGKPTQGAPR